METAEPKPVEPAPPSEWFSPGVLVPVYVLLLTAGYFVFVRGWCTNVGQEPSKPLSILTVVNAATLTGFQVSRGPNEFKPFGQWVTLLMMVGGCLFSLIGGGLPLVRIARLGYRDATIAAGAVVAVAASAVAGLVLYQPQTEHRWVNLFDAVYQSVSAFGNGGLYVGRRPEADWRATVVLLPLAVLGGLGVPVLLDLCRGRWSAHTVRLLTGTAAVYLLTVAVLTPALAYRDQWKATREAVGRSAVTAAWQAANARSAGFPFVTVLPAGASVVLLAAMLVGGGPGGTAGGLKVTTVMTVGRGIADAVRGRPARRAFGLAVGWVGIYVAIVGLSWLALVLTEPDKRSDQMLFLAVSGVGNVGLSHTPVNVSMAGMVVLSLAMLAGRVLPILVLWTVAGYVPEVDEPIG